MQVANLQRFAFLFWKTLKKFFKNNCQKICTIEKNVVPLHRFFAPLNLEF